MGRDVQWLIVPISDVLESSRTISLFGLHAAPDQVESVDVSGDISKYRQSKVNQQVTTASRHDRHRSGREEDRHEDEDDIRALDHVDNLVGFGW